MDASQWPQHHQIGGLGRTMEEVHAPNNIMNTNMSTITTNSSSNSMVERKVRPQTKDQVVNCPRCNSTNTKFCYYNNYSLAQPRYFCKTCRRYWTHGGSLRNVPVGGGSRKNKRSSPSILANPSSTSSKINPNLNPPNTLPHLMSMATSTPNNNNNNKLLFLDAHDLNLAFPMQGNISNSTPMVSRGGLSSYVPMSMSDPNSPLYPSGLPNLQEFKGVFSTSHGGDNGNNNDNNNDNNNINGARLLFPFADMNKLASSVKSAHHEHDHHDQTKGEDHDHQHQHQHHDHHQGPTHGYYWSGMLGGGTW